MVAALCFLVQINDRIIPLLEVGHGCLPAVVGSKESWLLGMTTTGGTQASGESTLGAESSMLGKDTSSAEGVIYKDRKSPGDCLRKLTWIGDMLWNIQNFVAGGLFSTRTLNIALRHPHQPYGLGGNISRSSRPSPC